MHPRFLDKLEPSLPIERSKSQVCMANSLYPKFMVQLSKPQLTGLVGNLQHTYGTVDKPYFARLVVTEALSAKKLQTLSFYHKEAAILQRLMSMFSMNVD
jgi:hypothetical protein